MGKTLPHAKELSQGQSRCKEQSKGPVTPESPAFRDDARDLLQLPFECCRSSARNNRFTCNQSPDSFGRRCAKRSQYRRANVRDDRRTAFPVQQPTGLEFDLFPSLHISFGVHDGITEYCRLGEASTSFTQLLCIPAVIVASQRTLSVC